MARRMSLLFAHSKVRLLGCVSVRLLIVPVIASAAVQSSVAQPTRGGATVPVRELTVKQKSPQLFANIFQVRAVANDAVLLNDGLRRQLILLNKGLAFSRIVLDSVSSGERYGPVVSPLIPALGDSTLFIDRESRALLVIDPSGKVVRTTAAPTQPRDFAFLAMSRSGIDGNGNLIFRVPALPTTPKRIGDTTSKIVVTETRPPQTAPVLRANFDTRKSDTVIMVKQVSGVRSVLTMDPSAPRSELQSVKVFLNPLETIDEWALLSDGSIAVVRGGDYHIDFVRPNGTHESGPKLPFDWKAITDIDKQRIIDSARTAMEAVVSAAQSRGGNAAANTAIAMALQGMVVNMAGVGAAPPTSVPDHKYSAAERAQPLLNYEIGPLKELPDYYPPIRQGAALGDADGALWVLPATSAQSKAGELVYDVINGRGELTHRVRLPVGRSIVGFGRGGVVYLMSKETDGWRLERAALASR